jgi:hypothetical protein
MVFDDVLRYASERAGWWLRALGERPTAVPVTPGELRD